MSVKIKGVRQAQQKLNKLIDDVQGRKAMRAIQSALIIGSGRAALYTPIGDTSVLINSQFREVTLNGTRLTGRVGYSANYAKYVHDPNIPQKFRRSTAQKEFLTKGFDEERQQISSVIAKEMSL